MGTRFLWELRAISSLSQKPEQHLSDKLRILQTGDMPRLRHQHTRATNQLAISLASDGGRGLS
jgi:hypothetical protein